MVFPEIPADVSDRVRRLFRSEVRKKVAMELLFFDHWPNQEEKEEIASRHSVDSSTVGKTLYLLRDNDFITKEQGSIPLYRARLRDEVDGEEREKGMEDDTRIPPNGGKRETGLDEIPPIGGKMEDGLEEIPPNGNIVENVDRINAIDSRVHTIGNKLDTFISEMRTTINQISVIPSKDNPGPVDELNNSTLAPPESVEGRLERLERLQQENGERDPFDDLSREQIIELIRSQPQEIMTMANPRSGGQAGRVEGQPVTLRPMILMLTTYSQMLYERAVYDGYFEGTLSDFVNFAMEQYFTDRGWGLDWNKREPANRSRRLG